MDTWSEPPIPLLRLGHPLAFAAYLRRIGSPVDSALRKARLPVLCGRRDVYVPVHRAWAFYDEMSKRESPTLGWQVGRWAQETPVRRESKLELSTTPTLKMALESLCHVVRLDNTHLRLRIIKGARAARLCMLNPYSADVPGYDVSQSYALMTLIALIRRFAGASWVSPELGIQAPCLPARAEELLNGSRVATNQLCAYVMVPRALLGRAPESTWSTSLKQQPERRCRARAETPTSDFVETLSLLVESYLEDGSLTGAQAAEFFGVSRATLHRRLKALGLTYATLVRNVRFNRARRLLERSDAKIVDVAYATGYTDPSHFTRAFRRISGLTPREHRGAVCHLS